MSRATRKSPLPPPFDLDLHSSVDSWLLLSLRMLARARAFLSLRVLARALCEPFFVLCRLTLLPLREEGRHRSSPTCNVDRPSGSVRCRSGPCEKRGASVSAPNASARARALPPARAPPRPVYGCVNAVRWYELGRARTFRCRPVVLLKIKRLLTH